MNIPDGLSSETFQGDIHSKEVSVAKSSVEQAVKAIYACRSVLIL